MHEPGRRAGIFVPRRLRLGRGDRLLRVDLLQTDALGFKGVGPRDHGAQHAGPNQDQQQEIGADVLEQDRKQERVSTAPTLPNEAAKPAPVPRIAIGKISPAIR